MSEVIVMTFGWARVVVAERNSRMVGICISCLCLRGCLDK